MNRKKLKTYEVWYEPHDNWDIARVKASSPQKAKEIIMKREELAEDQIGRIVRVRGKE